MACEEFRCEVFLAIYLNGKTLTSFYSIGTEGRVGSSPGLVGIALIGIAGNIA